MNGSSIDIFTFVLFIFFIFLSDYELYIFALFFHAVSFDKNYANFLKGSMETMGIEREYLNIRVGAISIIHSGSYRGSSSFIHSVDEHTMRKNWELYLLEKLRKKLFIYNIEVYLFILFVLEFFYLHCGVKRIHFATIRLCECVWVGDTSEPTGMYECMNVNVSELN